MLVASRPELMFAHGKNANLPADGVSDLSAARETDLLFAKHGHDLINYCARENVPFTVFKDWSDILSKCKAIVEGRTTAEQAAKEGYEAYKSGAASADTVTTK
jgi:hypothetical protein